MAEAEEITVEASCGNVFADLDLEDSEELLAKSNLVHHILSIIEERSLRNSEAAALFHITLPSLERLMDNQVDDFTTEQLLHFLTALDQDVEIVIRSKPGDANRHGQVSVVHA